MRAESGVDREGSTARTEARASNPITAEDEARAMLGRMGVAAAWAFSSGDVAELANLIADAERLIGIIGALRCTENIFEPLPARKKHDAIFKQHDEFLLSLLNRYQNHFDKYVWEHIRPPEAS